MARKRVHEKTFAICEEDADIMASHDMSAEGGADAKDDL